MVPRGLGWLLTSRSALVVLTLVYVAFGFAFLASDTTLHDEGLVTVMWATWARDAFASVFFYQKSKPILAALYLPAASIGPHVCLAAHLVLASLAIPLIGSTARALGHTLPNLPAFVLAMSPIYFLGGASGLSNIDGVLAATLALYLLIVRRNELLAGVVLGMLPWVRHELALLSALFFVRALLVTRSKRLLLGTVVFPLLYAAAGAIYHHDALWLLHYPPTTVQPMPQNPVWEPVSSRATIAMVVGVTPLALLAFVPRPARFGSMERALWVYAMSWSFLMLVLPAFRIANFGFVPRYALAALPMLALLASRTLEGWWEGERAAPWQLVPTICLAVLWGVGQCQDALAITVVLAGSSLAIVLSSFGQGHAATAAVVALVASGPWLPLRFEIKRTDLAPYLSEMTDWLRAHPDSREHPIFTNVPLLAMYAGNAGRTPGLDVLFLLGVDQHFDFVEMANPANGQRAALEAAARASFNGSRGVLPAEVTLDAIPDGSLFVLRSDDRLPMLLPPAIWAPHLVPLAGGSFQVFRYVR